MLCFLHFLTLHTRSTFLLEDDDVSVREINSKKDERVRKRKLNEKKKFSLATRPQLRFIFFLALLVQRLQETIV